MAAFEERLIKAATSTPEPPPDITSLAREFADFKSLVWDTISSFKMQVDLLSLGLDRHETFLRRKVLLLHGVDGVEESKDRKNHHRTNEVSRGYLQRLGSVPQTRFQSVQGPSYPG